MICTSRRQRVVGGDRHTAYHQCLILIQWYCWMKRPGPTLHVHAHMRPVPPIDMQLVLYKGGWRVSVSPTLVESNLTAASPC